MTNRTMIRAGTACLTVAAALVAAPAFAQDSAAGTEEDDGAIVVTAQRREERLIDVPVSIAAIGEDRITATGARDVGDLGSRSEEHTSELQSLMRISYAVFCLKKKKKIKHKTQNDHKPTPKTDT